MNFLQDIFNKILRKFKLTAQPKKEQETDYTDTSNLSITALLAERLSTITLTDSTVEVAGDSARAKYLNDFADRFWKEKIKAACVTSLGTGDCIMKPNTDGEHIAVDIISNNNFLVTENVGSYVYGTIIKCDEFWQNSAHYERLEYHRLRTIDGQTSCYIYQLAYRNGQEVPLTSVEPWAEFPQEMIIPNVDRLLFGRIKCPVVNRENVNSPNGVPITYGLDDIVLQAKNSIDRYNQEFADKETMLFADKSLFVRGADGEAIIPKGKQSIFMTFRGDPVDGAKKVDTFSPDIRDGSLENGIERNFRLLEMGAGLGEGVLSKSTLIYTNVDEVRASRSATYAFMVNFRNMIDQGFEDLLYSVNILCNANNIVPMGNWEYVPDWSDQYMTSQAETFNQLLQSEAIGVVDKAEVRSWVMNEDLTTAEEKVTEIEANKPQMPQINPTNFDFEQPLTETDN